MSVNLVGPGSHAREFEPREPTPSPPPQSTRIPKRYPRGSRLKTGPPSHYPAASLYTLWPGSGSACSHHTTPPLSSNLVPASPSPAPSLRFLHESCPPS